ncbi:MAG: argininosuccinate lyase [Candidatus Sumerlaeia bacterium]|nr:argininosuccinate lyase [Candidatus Sumerlaeia bacterium]
MAALHPEGRAGRPVWGSRLERGPHAGSLRYTSGWDVRSRPAADLRLAEHDLDTNAAHLAMLASTGILDRADAGRIAAALLDLRDAPPEALLLEDCEDIHMSVEALLTRSAGPAAGAIHTARSRNDQVATDIRLWLRGETIGFGQGAARLALAIAAHARENANLVCPGFTHAQPAMLSTWGHWTASWLAPVARLVKRATALLAELDECPLGAAAGFGTSWPIDRAFTAKLLGFSSPTRHSFEGTATRGELEARFAMLAAELLGQLSRTAQDLVFASSPPREWVRLPDSFVTGSSIMPNKRNPDVAEVTLGRTALARGYVEALLGSVGMLPGGYNRGLQWTKYVLFDAADNFEGAAEVFADLLMELETRPEPMRAACSVGFLEAADLADRISSRDRLPFRTVYKFVGEAVRRCDPAGRFDRASIDAVLAESGVAPLRDEDWAWLCDPDALVASRDQHGSPAPKRVLESVDALTQSVKADAALLLREQERIAAARESLWERIAALSANPAS